eukprot:m.113291 g.113291  ORF g.113291 m.113291 type:complete len:386 (+) comp14126_c0_seq2:63-1220(+)
MFLAFSYMMFAAATPLLNVSSQCRNNMDCQLNGDCVNGSCVCDSAWSGSADCSRLKFIPISQEAGYHNKTAVSWGGIPILENGQWHLFVAQMELNCTLDDYGTNSAIIRAVSNHPEGPFNYAETVVRPFAHNPTAHKLPDGSIAIWFIGDGSGPTPKDCRSNIPSPLTSSSSNFSSKVGGCGGISVAHSKSVFGPWTITPLLVSNCASSRWLNCSFTNPAPHILPNGTVLMAFQAGYCHHPAGFGLELLGVARATSFLGPYELLTGNPLVKNPPYCLAGTAEDPTLWRNSRGWHIIAHGMCYAPFDSMHFYSEDAYTWHKTKQEPYTYLVEYNDTDAVLFERVERPQLLFSPTNNTPMYLFNGVCKGLSCYEHPGRTWTLARKLS